MSEPSAPLSLLNVFDIESETGPRRLLCFVDPVIAGARGIDPRAIVGEFPAELDHVEDPSQFSANPAFIQTFILYMNQVASSSPGLTRQAAANAGETLYVVDPRVPPSQKGEPLPHDVLGAYQIGPDGTIVPGSFGYNEAHLWFHADSGVSGVFADRAFYDWIHVEPPAAAEE